jgi:uncharacterized damage-inducible protein DinB
MKTTFVMLLTAAATFAQAPDFKSAAGGAKAYYMQVKNNIVKAAEKMPAENYSFKPTPDVRSYGQLIAHVADASGFFCGAISGAKAPAAGVEKGKTSKEDIVAALKENLAFCDKAYDGLTDANAGETVKFFGSDRSKLNIASFNAMHDWEHYGNIVTYLRLKNIVPPSSEKK